MNMLAGSEVLYRIIGVYAAQFVKVPQELLYELHKGQALLPCRLIDARVDEVFVQHGATPVYGGGISFLFINLLLFLSLLLCFNVLS